MGCKGCRGTAMGGVIMLSIRERSRQDEVAIKEIHRNLGTAAAERVVSRALDEIATTMARIRLCLRQRDLGDVPRQLRRVRVMAEGLGMTSLAGVSRDAAHCLRRGDDTAFAAVCARLWRVAEHSLARGRDALDASS